MPRLRFSLATLLLFVLLAGSAGALYHRWGPWVVEKRWEKLSVADQKKPGLMSAVYSPDSQRVVVGTEKATAIYDVRTGAELTRLQFPPDHQYIAWEAKFSPDGRWVHLNSPRRRFDAATGVEDPDFAVRFADSKETSAGEMYYSPDFTKRLVKHNSGRVVLFDGPEFGQKHELYHYSSDTPALLGFGFSDDATVMAAADATDSSLRIFDLLQYKQIALLKNVDGLKFSPTGDKIVIQTVDGLELWNLGGGTSARQWIFSGMKNTVCQAYFSPDGSRILAGSVISEHFVILDASNGLKLAALGEPVTRAIAPNLTTRQTEWRPDGAQIMVGDTQTLTFYRRTRPEWWWGVFYLPELWTTGILAGMLLLRMKEKLRKPNSVPHP